MSDVLTVGVHGAIRVVTLNRPDALNAIDTELHRALLDVWFELDRDPDARCVVLTGAGRAFSGGGDFAFMKAQHVSVPERLRVGDEAGAILTAMMNFRLPIVAAVNGPAVGLGASLVLSCDLVLMSEKAFLCDPHVSVGLTAGDGGALLWPHMMSLIKAKEYVYTGERIPASIARELGLANRVLPPEDLIDAAMELAEKLAGQPARALQTTKRAFNKHLAQSAVAIIDYGLAAEAMDLGSDDHIARIRAAIGDDAYDAIDTSSTDR